MEKRRIPAFECAVLFEPSIVQYNSHWWTLGVAGVKQTRTCAAPIDKKSELFGEGGVAKSWETEQSRTAQGHIG